VSPSSSRRRLTGGVLAGSLAAAVLPLLAVSPASAITTYTAADGVAWTVNDARRPGLDTGSIRNVANSRMEAMGSLFVHVDSADAPRMNDQMLRGFGLQATGTGSYVSTRSVRLGDLLVSRKLNLSSTAGTAAFFDTFTNTSTSPLTVDASFGGSFGSGDPATTPTTAGTVSATSSGDAVIDGADTWATATTPNAGSTTYRPTGVVVGGGVTHVGNQQLDPFTSTYSPTGSASNNPGFVHELTLQPGETASLLQYVVTGARGDQTDIATTTAALAATPATTGLSVDEVCTLANWDPTTLAGYSAAVCAGAQPLQLPTAPEATPEVKSTVAYDVNGKTIQQLQADMTAGTVTSVQVTKAYLDRIEAYDGGQLGFHAFITVAKTAVAQAMAADEARAAGRTGELLGIPLAIKDLYDTKDMPTTGGTMALEDWQPGVDAWQVAKLREAGAVIIGKTNLSEFANSGSFSESGFKQTWNALYPSKTSFGSSGGSAVAVATGMAAAAMGTQTGVSLYAPSTGASLSAFRGTDGLASTGGVMPLTWATDYAGPIAKDVTDLSYLLDATATQTTGDDPDDVITHRVDNSLRPKDWSAALDKDALKGKVIGYPTTAFASKLVTDDNTGAEAFAAVKAAIEAAGGTLVPLDTNAPTTPSYTDLPITSGTSLGAEGWYQYMDIARPNTFPFATPGALLSSQANLPYNVGSTSYNNTRYDATSVNNLLARRDRYKDAATTWMDTAGPGGTSVDAVVYPGFLTGVGNNDASSAVMSSDRASGVLTQSIGLPTAIIPIGTNDRGQSNNVQIMGRAWDDVNVLSYGYAVEQAKSEPALRTTYAPSLAFAGPVDSTTSLSLGSTAVTYGTATSATVSVASDPVATGTVTVSVAGKTVTGTLAGGRAVVRLPAGIGVGTYLVTARYAGSSTVAASAATATIAVRYAKPSVRATLVKKKVKAGKKARVRVTVGSGAASSLVLVYDGSRLVTSATVRHSGTITLPKLKKGKHRLRLTAVGDASYASASTTVVLRVVRR
jgi:Asp-tRNA(Asn)/Glu-tRNA(Gln) amidotransferase A subunit family amidase